MKSPQSFVKSGQSLIEVVVATGVSVLVLTSLVAAVVVAIRNVRFAQNQSLATKYAQEGIEKIRIYRDQNDWDATFKSESNCENPSGLDTPPQPFKRVIDCSLEEESRMKVTVTVSWAEAGRTHKSKLTTYLTKWQ